MTVRESFEQTVRDVASNQGGRVAEEKRNLQPTRAALVAIWKDFMKDRPRVEADAQQAMSFRQHALTVGVNHSGLTTAMKEFYGDGTLTNPGLLQSTQAIYEQALRQIDGLTEQDLHAVNAHKGLYTAPEYLRSNVGKLTELAADMQAITREGGPLHQMVLSKKAEKGTEK